MNTELHFDNLKRQIRDRGIELTVLCNRENIQYVTGLCTSFYDDPSVLLIFADEAILVLPASAEDYKEPDFIDRLMRYSNYNPRTDFDKLENLAGTVNDCLKAAAGKKLCIGIESSDLTASLSGVLKSCFSGSEFEDIGGLLKQMRRLKSPGEVEAIRRSVRVADAGHAAIRKAAYEGEVSELVLFGKIRSCMEEAAGERITIKADILSGPRTALIGGPPTNRIVRKGELLIADLIPCVDGYWADTTSTISIGEPAQQQVELHAIVAEALRRGLDMIKPGVAACEVDKSMRSFIERQGYGFPHHSGHGFGLSDFEAPLIGPDNLVPIEENMVLTLEPGIYDESFGGIRLEDNVLVTAEGAVVLSTHSKQLN